MKLTRVKSGYYRVIINGVEYTFLRHESDPKPQRWYVYEDSEDEPMWFAGHLSLRAAKEALTQEIEREKRSSQ